MPCDGRKRSVHQRTFLRKYSFAHVADNLKQKKQNGFMTWHPSFVHEPKKMCTEKVQGKAFSFRAATANGA